MTYYRVPTNQITITPLMSNPEEPSQAAAENQREPDATDTVSLVDLFDELDRAAFERALAQRDINYPNGPNR